MKKGKEVCAGCTITPQSAKVIAIVHGKYLDGKSIKYVDGRHNQKICSHWQQHVMPEVFEPMQRLQQIIPWNEWHTKPFTASKAWLNRFRNRIGMKNIEITEEAMSAIEKGVATF